MKFYLGKKAIDVKKVSEIGKFTGLMFRSRETENLLFDFSSLGKRGIHSFFVFFNFIAVFIDDKNRIVEIRKVRPFTMLVVPRKNYQKLVEIPCNERNAEIIDFLVGKETFK